MRISIFSKAPGRTQKKQSFEVEIWPKPEEVPEKKKFWRSWDRGGGLRIVFCASSGLCKVFKEILPKPEEAPKTQSYEVNILPKPEEVPRK